MIFIKYLQFISLYFISFLCRPLFRINPNVLLFSARGGAGFEGNAKYLYLYACKNTDFSCVWITKKKRVFDELKAKGHNVCYFFSWSAFKFSMQAKAVFITHSMSDAMPVFYKSETIIIDLWHGISTKNVAFLDKNLGLKSRIMDCLKSNRLNYFISNTKEFNEIYQRSFRLAEDKIKPLGYSRIEFLQEPAKFGLKHVNLLSKGNKNILYAPTFRDYKFTDDFLDLHFLKHINTGLLNRNEFLYLKLHPSQSTPVLEGLSNIKALSSAVDIYQVLPYVDVLISDYSSVVFDFIGAYQKREIILYTPDLKRYKEQRGFSIEFESIFADVIVLDKFDIFVPIKRTLQFNIEHPTECSQAILKLLNE